MGAPFFSYAEILEMLAFFSGYPVIYFTVITFAGKKETVNSFMKLLVPALAVAYAITGTLYLGLQLKNLYPLYTLSNIGQNFYNPFFKTWALLSVIFWLPFFRKKTFFCLLHSSVFFCIILRDLWQYVTDNPGYDAVKNDMKLFTVSLLLNTAALAASILIYLFFNRVKEQPSQHG